MKNGDFFYSYVRNFGDLYTRFLVKSKMMIKI